ncbi:hypothetical protein BDE36_4618 [Arcticibacter tournemirensis]|uniref:Uncharacterized protein n=1 Tax=Arcticibacter tournemirensis TaxID=699437 RepID=A0A5M9HFZ1_9SPHI|nr:DUF3226 domain-containing protein [Arcticibacter tournemirensis]KAA8485882.1 hypothetical protein F1649_02475 [Arcticibacter tournemirensis]TQM46864.1 hypothetical protein BDE36_4618 [Arcticibacter tournemirensis]
MAKQIITVLCEGPHDVAFICRILKSIGYKSNESIKIGEYPKPFDALLTREATKTDVEQLNLTELRRNLLPSNVLLRGETHVFLYSLGGDGKVQIRQRILTELRSLVVEDGEIIADRNNDAVLSLVYLFDADQLGVAGRLAQINNEIKSALPSEVTTDLFANNGTHAKVSKMKLGAFIFTDDGNITGKLEDILVPLMKIDNEPSFDAAAAYLVQHHDDARLYPLKLTIEGTAITEARSVRQGDKEKFDQKKSLIGTVGQLQRSGKSNVVCISDSDYLSLEKLANNHKCVEIASFFESFTNV